MALVSLKEFKHRKKINDAAGFCDSIYISSHLEGKDSDGLFFRTSERSIPPPDWLVSQQEVILNGARLANQR